jgi:hypothetical protein
MIRMARTEMIVRIHFGPMPGMLPSAGNADTIAALPAAVWTATVTT